ncbi:FtsX-like permease family protein [Streptomyces sp. NBC_01637]|uniref:FtsX-like permease family protein n=1 Tax=unclassified Streptomyces TaxID=2593676 RepID=UPI00386373BC|nr:FtsX-like permease family protein [Streptomyces sp. NBC_01653]WTD90104.1 FtsX-like permease family protein [Streptomyces sp. NBC_01637]
MSVFTGWRAALRIARRDAMRAKGRSALVVAMIALPVLGVTAADVTYRSVEPTRAEKLMASMGSADALFSDPGMGSGAIQQMPDGQSYGPASEDSRRPGDEPVPPIDIRAALPEGAHAISIQSVPATVTTEYGITTADIVEFRTSDPMARGKVTLVRGAFPHGDGEMAATEPFLTKSGLHVGSRTTLHGAERTYTITGVVEQPDDLKSAALYAEPGAVIAPWTNRAEHDKKVLPPNADSKDWLVRGAEGAGVSWSDVLAANARGVLVISRQVVLDPPPDSEVPMARSMSGNSYGDSEELSAALITVVAMAVLELVLLAGPAFAVGARRSRRQLGLVGTCGGDRRHVRAVVLSGGLVLGGVGAVAGVAAGFALTAVFRPMIEGWAGNRFGSLAVHPSELLIIAVIGLVTGLLAALVPAIVASRQSVLESLSGRRGIRHSSRVLPVLGSITLLIGIAVAVYGGTSGNSTLVAGGSVVAELGLLGCIPVIVGFLGRLGRRLPLSPRMALRDAARNRGRTAPAVAAVMAAVAGSVAIATYMSSGQAESEFEYTASLTPGTVALVASDDKAADRLPLARATVERNLAVTGGHADVGRIWAGSDCNVYYEEEDSCGSVELIKPAGKDHSCPLVGKGAKKLAASLSAEEHRKLMRSPACLDELMYASPFIGMADGVVLGDAKFLSTYVKLQDPAAAKALEAGTPVLLNPAYAKNGEVTLKAVHRYSDRDKKNRKLHPGKAETRTDRLKVYQAPEQYATTPGVRMILPLQTAKQLGLHTEMNGSVYAVAHEPTDSEEQRVSAAVEVAGGGIYLQSERGPSGRQDTILLFLSLFAGVVTLGAAAIATGLAKADAEADLTTLSAVGAPPRVRRTLSGFQCLVVALTGVLLGTAAGLVPAVALRLIDLREAVKNMRVQPMESAYTPIVLPWETIGLLAVVVPLLAGLGAAAFTRSRQTVARRAG